MGACRPPLARDRARSPAATTALHPHHDNMERFRPRLRPSTERDRVAPPEPPSPPQAVFTYMHTKSASAGTSNRGCSSELLAGRLAAATQSQGKVNPQVGRLPVCAAAAESGLRARPAAAADARRVVLQPATLIVNSTAALHTSGSTAKRKARGTRCQFCGPSCQHSPQGGVGSCPLGRRPRRPQPPAPSMPPHQPQPPGRPRPLNRRRRPRCPRPRRRSTARPADPGHMCPGQRTNPGVQLARPLQRMFPAPSSFAASPRQSACSTSSCCLASKSRLHRAPSCSARRMRSHRRNART